jgi:hypothetical protein
MISCGVCMTKRRRPWEHHSLSAPRILARPFQHIVTRRPGCIAAVGLSQNPARIISRTLFLAALSPGKLSGACRCWCGRGTCQLDVHGNADNGLSRRGTEDSVRNGRWAARHGLCC